MIRREYFLSSFSENPEIWSYLFGEGEQNNKNRQITVAILWHFEMSNTVILLFVQRDILEFFNISG